jgi:radical SAM superfamily enzyme YgiQ (UPF0313 family)
LVYPTTLDAQNKPIKYRKAYLPPLSLATIAALTPRQHAVRVVNDVVENLDFSEDWDIVGLTAMTPQAERTYQVADEFRRRGAKVVIGGIHASMLPQEAKEHADAVVIGEAENIWTDVLADCERGRPKDYYQDSCLPDLKRPVVPRWECLNMRVYPRQFGSTLPMMPIFTTRGCPYGCRFCSVTQFLGKSYRTRPISTVLSEIQGTGAREFFFVDDNIAADPDYSRELFRSLQNMELRWMSQASTTILKNPDLLDLAAKAGCFGLFVGVESLNKESLAGARKSFNKVDLYGELLRRMRSAGITPFLSFIFGFDQDLKDQFEVTISFLTRNQVGSAIFWILTPVPGTDLYKELQNDGRIISTNWSQYDGIHVVFNPKTWSSAELSDRYWNAFKKIYRPPRLIRNILWNARFSKQPWRSLLRGAFYQSYFWLKLRAGEHPYSGGIGRLRYP